MSEKTTAPIRATRDDRGGHQAASKLMLAALLTFLPAGCASGQRSLAGLDATQWMQHSAEYEASAEQAYRIAEVRLFEALEDTAWTAALEQRRGFGGLPPAVILDADETVLDNTPFQANLVATGGEFEPVSWGSWVREARAPPVPGALEFTQMAAGRGVTVFYVTNRDHDLEEATRQNLRELGFSLTSDTDVLLTRGEREGWGSDKRSRREHVAASYRILLLIGDDLNDFVSGVTSSAAERERVAARYIGRWGREWIVLPNPTYGSWERALYDFESGLSSEERRERRLEKLEATSGGGSR